MLFCIMYVKMKKSTRRYCRFTKLEGILVSVIPAEAAWILRPPCLLATLVKLHRGAIADKLHLTSNWKRKKGSPASFRHTWKQSHHPIEVRAAVQACRRLVGFRENEFDSI